MQFMRREIASNSRKKIQYAVALEALALDDTDKVISKFQKYVKTGAHLLTIPFLDLDSLHKFAKEILPSF